MSKIYPNFVQNSSNLNTSHSFFHLQRVEFQASKNQKLLMLLGGYTIAIGTIAFTAMMWWTNQDSQINKILYTALSIGMGIGEFILWPMVINALTRGAWVRAILPIIAGTFCFAFSMSGTIGYMSSAADAEIAKENQVKEINFKKQSAFELVRKSLFDSTQSAATQRQTQAGFNSRSMLSKASESGKSLVEIEKQKSINLNKLIKEAHEKPAEVTTPAPFLSLYKTIHSVIKTDDNDLTIEDVKKWFSIIFAIAVEITGICLIAAGKEENNILLNTPSPSNNGNGPKGKKRKSWKDVKSDIFGRAFSFLNSKNTIHASASKDTRTDDDDDTNQPLDSARTTRMFSVDEKPQEKSEIIHATPPEIYTDNMKLYAKATKARVGESIKCPQCKINFTKKIYNQKFCQPKHKDDFWNEMKPERLKAKGKMAGKKKVVLREIKKPKFNLVKG